MSDYLSEYISRLGWGTGFHLPIANEENRKLEKILAESQRANFELRTKVEETNKRVVCLQTRLEQTQVLSKNITLMVQTKNASVTHAKSLHAMTSTQKSNLDREAKEKFKKLNALKMTNLKAKIDIEKRQRVLNKFAEMLKLDQVAISAMKASAADEEYEMNIIDKYFQIDDRIIKDARITYKTLKAKNLSLLQKLEKIAQNTKLSEQVLERTSSQFRSVNKSRIEAVQNWKEVVESLKKRDADIQSLADEYADLQSLLTQKNQLISEQESLLATNQRNCQETEYAIKKILDFITEAKLRLKQNISSVATLNSYITTTRLDVRGVSTALKSTRQKLAQNQSELSTTNEREKNLANELLSLRKRHKEFKFGSSSVDEKLREISSVLEREEGRVEEKNLKVEKARDLLLVAANKRIELKNQVNEAEAQLKGNKNMFRGLNGRIKENLKTLDKKKGMYFELQIRYFQVSDKLNRGTPEGLNFERQERLFAIKNTREKLQLAERENAVRANHNGHIHSLVVKFKREIDGLLMDGQRVNTELLTTEMFLNSNKTELTKMMKMLNDKKFELSMVLLTQSRLQRAFKQRNENLFTTEQQKLILTTIARERNLEIRSYMSLQEQKKRCLEDTKLKLKSSISEVESLMKRLKNKYEIIMTTMTGAGNSQNQVSEAYLIIKFAQEREFLKRDGEIWDKKVQEAEKEVLGLQNTLALMVTSNKSFKQSLAPVFADNEIKEKVRLQNQQLRLISVFKKKTEQRLFDLFGKVEDQETEINQLRLAIELLEGTLLDRKEELNTVLQELNGQKSKIERSKLMCKKLVKEMDHLLPEEKELLEAEIHLKCLREKFDFGIKAIQKALATLPSIKEEVLTYLESDDRFKRLLFKVQRIVSGSITSQYHSWVPFSTDRAPSIYKIDRLNSAQFVTFSGQVRRKKIDFTASTKTETEKKLKDRRETMFTSQHPALSTLPPDIFKAAHSTTSSAKKQSVIQVERSRPIKRVGSFDRIYAAHPRSLTLAKIAFEKEKEKKQKEGQNNLSQLNLKNEKRHSV